MLWRTNVFPETIFDKQTIQKDWEGEWVGQKQENCPSTGALQKEAGVVPSMRCYSGIST